MSAKLPKAKKKRELPFSMCANFEGATRWIEKCFGAIIQMR